ncbi:unnamed protein product [Cuscuta epithymum]|uniref:Helitron helicase-like domain-containing protein n=1 Tax=Cuscuta epithymum TaxID=186058 RepID=A0AAV0CIE6_9ASTE|nr:unnamed protein product [Cuscuta epithymum]
MFTFTSIGGKQDKDINPGKTPPIFRINGQNYHRIGSLLRRDGGQPNFLQMYLCDPSEETSNRLKVVRSEGGTKLHDALVLELTHMLDMYNVHAQLFRMARDRFNASNSTTLKMRLIMKRSSEGRTYNAPSISEVTALIEGDFDVNRKERDIVLQPKSGAFQFVIELNSLFLGLQYPLLFPYGQDGFREDVRLTRAIGDINSNRGRKFATMKDFFSYRLQERQGETPYLLRCQRLFQQYFAVDGYTMIESYRLQFIRFHQKEIQSDVPVWVEVCYM